MVFRWQADDGPFIAVFGSYIPSSTKKEIVIKFGLPLTKLSGSAHDTLTQYENKTLYLCEYLLL